MTIEDDGIVWEDDPEKHDYPAARSFLGLLFIDERADRLVKDLRRAPLTKFKAKDVLRASGLPALDLTNAHVQRDTDKITSRQALSPILLIRGQPLIIADGYHRVCALHLRDEDCWVHTKIV